MTWPIRALGEVVKFLDNLRKPVTASDRRDGPFPYYGANGLQGTINDFIFDEDLVLVAEDGGHFGSPERGVAYKVTGRSWVNNHAHVLRPNDTVNVDFLTRVLENYDFQSFISGSELVKVNEASVSLGG